MPYNMLVSPPYNLKWYKRTLFKQDPLQQGVLVSEHEALICRASVGGLEAVEVRLMDSDGLLELLDVLSAALTESRLGLSVPLLALLGGRVYLR